MQYGKVISASFLERPNRFIAHVSVNGERRVAHVKNTGRCRELLIPGCRVWLSATEDPLRKTAYDLIAVEKERDGKPPLLINMDAQVPNDVAEEYLRAHPPLGEGMLLRREVKKGGSRFDFCLKNRERVAFLEVKGVTLEENGHARFPDAPTERGVKHLRELTACLAEGYEAYVLFVIQMSEVRSFSPNDETHKAFGDALRAAAEAGVRLLAVDCRVTPDSITFGEPVPILL